MKRNIFAFAAILLLVHAFFAAPAAGYTFDYMAPRGRRLPAAQPSKSFTRLFHLAAMEHIASHAANDPDGGGAWFGRTAQ